MSNPIGGGTSGVQTTASRSFASSTSSAMSGYKDNMGSFGKMSSQNNNVQNSPTGSTFATGGEQNPNIKKKEEV